MKRWKQAGALVALAAMSACGGSGGGGSTPVAITPAPSPTPTPTPSPTPAATRFQAEAASALVGAIRFYRSDIINPGSPDYANFLTDRTGLFYRGLPNPIGATFQNQPFVDDGQNAVTAFGVDRLTSIALNVQAPRGSTTISPITALIYEVGDQVVVKRALMLDAQLGLERPDRDLRTFSWLAATDADSLNDAFRIRASNIRLVAFVAAINKFAIGPFYPARPEQRLQLDFSRLATIIHANPRIQLYTAAGVETVLRALPANPSNPQSYRDDVIAAAARLITQYAVTIGLAIRDDDTAGRYMLGIQGYLLPTLAELMEANSAAAAARVATVTTTTIPLEVAAFSDRPTPSDTLLFPGPDFFRLPVDGRTTIPFYDPLSNGSPSLASNDVTFFLQSNSFPLTLTGITVPARFAGQLSVTAQPDQSVVIEGLGGFTGIAWFDYGVRSPGGIAAIGRAYVIIR